MAVNEGEILPIPLSEARSRRREKTSLETSEQTLRAILSEVVENKVAAKLTRLENSMNIMLSQFEAIRSGDAEDAALRVTPDSAATDLASVGINIPSEDYYKYTCSDLVEKLGVRQHAVVQEIKLLGLRGDPHYHCQIRSGQKSFIQKWSDAALIKLRESFNCSGNFAERVLLDVSDDCLE